MPNQTILDDDASTAIQGWDRLTTSNWVFSRGMRRLGLLRDKAADPLKTTLWQDCACMQQIHPKMIEMVLKLNPSNINSCRPRNQNRWNGSAAVAHVKVRKSRSFSHDNRTYLDHGIPLLTSVPIVFWCCLKCCAFLNNLDMACKRDFAPGALIQKNVGRIETY